MDTSNTQSIGPGDVIDRKYQIVRLIGEGGMGAVFEGTNLLIRRRVAIKVLLAAAKESQGMIERFEREAQAAGCIGSDHILEVLDLGHLPNGDHYMVMEYLDGESMADRLRRVGRMAPYELAPLLRQALVGLDAAHAAGIVHRDLKPDNVFILREKAGRQDFVKLIDFGISKFSALSGDMSMTRTGAVMGTPYYMSPEQAKGAGGVNHLSDVYSMGVIAFEALTGKVPFEGTTFNDLMFKIVLSDMPSLEEAVPGMDPGFAAIVRRAMARDTAERFQSALEFIEAIDAWVPHAKTGIHGTPVLVHDELVPTERALEPRLDATTFVPMKLEGLADGAGAAALRASQPELDARGPAPASPPLEEANLRVPTRPIPLLWLGLAAGALVVAGGVFLLLGGSEETPPALEPVVVSSPVEPSSAPRTPPQPSPEPRSAPHPGASVASSGAPSPAAPSSAAPSSAAPPSAAPPVATSPAPSSSARPSSSRPSTSAPTGSAQAPSRPATSSPSRPAPAPSSPAPTTPPAKPTTTKPAGPDFGY